MSVSVGNISGSISSTNNQNVANTDTATTNNENTAGATSGATSDAMSKASVTDGMGGKIILGSIITFVVAIVVVGCYYVYLKKNREVYRRNLIAQRFFLVFKSTTT